MESGCHIPQHLRFCQRLRRDGWRLYRGGRERGERSSIQDELKANGSPKATIETDEERSYFLIDIPCHPEFVMEKVVLNKDFTKDFIKEKRIQLSERQERILFMILDDDTITSQKIAQKTGVSQRTILKDLNKLQTTGILARDGGRKNGTWVIVTT